MTPTVHVLYHGFVLCGSIHGMPRDWGPQHRWVSAFDGSWAEHATCAACREAAAKLPIWKPLVDLGSPEWIAAVERAWLADNPLLERHEQMPPPAGPVPEEAE